MSKIFGTRLVLWEKAIVCFILSSYLQLIIYFLRLALPGENVSLLNTFRLILVFYLVCEAFFFGFRPCIYTSFVLYFLICFAIYSIAFSLSDLIRVVSGIVSLGPLVLFLLCLSHKNDFLHVKTNLYFSMRLHIKLLLYLSFFCCLLNQLLYSAGIVTNSFGGVSSLFGLLPRNTSFFFIPGTAGIFCLSSILLLFFLQCLLPHLGNVDLRFDITVALIIIILSSAASAFVSLLIFLLLCAPYIRRSIDLKDNLIIGLIPSFIRILVLFIPVFLLPFILRRNDVFSSLTGRFAILDYFVTELGLIPWFPIPEFFGLATNYAQSSFGDATFVQTPDSLVVSLLVQFGIFLSSIILVAFLLPVIRLLVPFLYSIVIARSSRISFNVYLGSVMLLSCTPIILTSNILESYPFVFFFAFLYCSPLMPSRSSEFTFF